MRYLGGGCKLGGERSLRGDTWKEVVNWEEREVGMREKLEEVVWK